MSFEWDPEKSRRNRVRHGIELAEATAVLEDELALTMRDPDSGPEDRFVTIGCDARGRTLVVVYTWRGSRVRLISVRRATRRERHQYEEG